MLRSHAGGSTQYCLGAWVWDRSQAGASVTTTLAVRHMVHVDELRSGHNTIHGPVHVGIDMTNTETARVKPRATTALMATAAIVSFTMTTMTPIKGCRRLRLESGVASELS